MNFPVDSSVFEICGCSGGGAGDPFEGGVMQKLIMEEEEEEDRGAAVNPAN